MKAINPSGSRVNLSPDDTVGTVLGLVGSQNLQVLQFSERLPASLLAGLNADFFTQRPDVELRVFGFYGEACDLSFCSLMPNVRLFRADCLHEAFGVEHICKMPRLSSLGIGIWNLDSFAFLSDLSEGITSLWLSQTKSKKPDLRSLGHFKGLQKLCLAGQQKNIEVVSEQRMLEKLTLISVTLDSLNLVRALPRLSSFDLSLGGTKDLSALSGMDTLKHLELWKILGLDNIDVISSLTGLESLFLQSLIRIAAIPSLEKLAKLRTIYLEDMKGLVDISALAGAPALEELKQVHSRLPFKDYLPLLKCGTVKAAHVGFGNLKKNGRFRELCLQHGVDYNVACQ